jgi:hypothetical protein
VPFSVHGEYARDEERGDHQNDRECFHRHAAERSGTPLNGR